MANTQVQREVERWIRCEWLPRLYDQTFNQEPLRLAAGGVFVFDAVSADGSIVANISTSSARTTSGRGPAGKLQKLRADMLFLMMTPAKKKLIVLTENDMYELCQKEKGSGRVPDEIEFAYAPLPGDLAKSLHEARIIAAEEVAPR